MTSPASTEKRRRAADFPPVSRAAPTPGSLEVVWESHFDRLCYLVSATDLALKHRARYDALMAELMAGTGCTEDELLEHGRKVRAVLFFAEDRLAREGVLAGLADKQKHPYKLARVNPAF